MQLNSASIDFPKAFGFAVSFDAAAGPGHSDVRVVQTNALETVAHLGRTEIVTRFYPTTPESVHDSLPIRTRNNLVVFEGRVDNRSEVARMLRMPELASGSDGTVLAAAVDAWGAELAGKVIGEYAFAAVNFKEHRFVAGHDSLGVRRLFYGAVGNRLYAASNLRLLFEQFPDSRPHYNRDALPEYFTGTMAPWSGVTIWQGMRELGRGRALVLQDGTTQERQVWSPAPDRCQHFKSLDDLDEQFRTILFDAVRLSLRAEGPVLCDISGGFDSSTIASVASILKERGETTNSIVGWRHITTRSNEEILQDSVVRKYNIDSTTISLEKHLPFQVFCDSALPTGGFIQMGALDRAAREFTAARGIRSHLTGAAADALLHKRGGGPPVYLADWIRQFRLRDWLRHLRGYLKSGSISGWQLLRDCSVGTLNLHAGAPAELPNWFSPRFKRAVSEAEHGFLSLAPRTFRSDARERVYRWTLCFVPYAGGGLPDERLPFAYRPLVEFLLGLDWDHLVRPNEERLLIKRSLRQILPDEVRSGASRQAFISLIHEGFRAAWPRISHMVTGEHLADLGVVEPGPFRKALERFRAGYEGSHPGATRTALYLETWLGFKASALRSV